jgi:hypothetical protein
MPTLIWFSMRTPDRLKECTCKLDTPNNRVLTQNAPVGQTLYGLHQRQSKRLLDKQNTSIGVHFHGILL